MAAKERTEKSRYSSKYSPDGFVTAAQYATEIICEKKAWKEKKELPIFFWKLKEWTAFYRNQIATANKLLKEYDEAAIMKALRDKRTKNTYSLRAPWLLAIIKEEQHKIDLANARVKQERETAPVDVQPKEYKKQNILDVLGEL